MFIIWYESIIPSLIPYIAVIKDQNILDSILRDQKEGLIKVKIKNYYNEVMKINGSKSREKYKLSFLDISQIT